MAVTMSSGVPSFHGCPACPPDFNDLAWILDACGDDIIEDELDAWGYAHVPATGGELRVTLPCRGSVFLSWSNGVGHVSKTTC